MTNREIARRIAKEHFKSVFTPCNAHLFNMINLIEHVLDEVKFQQDNSIEQIREFVKKEHDATNININPGWVGATSKILEFIDNEVKK